jgi:hypothetical protein
MAYVPKRPRQAHIPSQQRTNRKPKRPFMTGAGRATEPLPDDEIFEPNFADPPLIQGGVSTGIGSGPVDTRPQPRPGRRLEMLRGNANRDTATSRITPGQLPTYQRAYLMDELRRISLISGGLLGVIIGLTVLLR